MPRLLHAAVAALVFGAAACTPTFNWRETRFDPSGLVALLPCKPDEGSRQIRLGERELPLSMKGCESGGVMFAIAWAESPDAAQAGALLAVWKRVTLANFSARDPKEKVFTPTHSAPDELGSRVSAVGQREGEGDLALEAAWFQHGRYAFQVLAFGKPLALEQQDTYFGGLRLQ